MKLRSLSVILLLQALPSLVYAASTDSSLGSVILPDAQGSLRFVAAGVNVADISSSDRFYDNGKGYYWQEESLYEKAMEEYRKAGDWSFLGDLTSRVPESANENGEFYVNLTNDGDSCWYNAGSNVLQYWQSYYGVFYRGVGDNGTDNALPYGHTYAEHYLEALAGTQSLQVDMLFYDNWVDDGGNTEMSASWYLAGDTSFPELNDNAASAGFFRDYFAATAPCVMEFRDEGFSMSELRDLLIDGLGLTANADGSFTQSEVGRIIDFGISSDAGGHAITCYGAEFDAAGNVTSVLIANSDDTVYGTERLYLKSENGRVYLYSDEACEQRWDYADEEDWYVDLIGYINTPDSLRRMYAQYTDAQNPLVWNGSNGSWDADAPAADPDLLPTEATGWDVYVTEGAFTDYYHSWYDASRPLEFGDRGLGGEIEVKGNITAGALSFNSDAYRYSLRGEGDNTVTAASLNITGKGGVTLSAVNLSVSEATISAGSLTLGSGAALTGGELCVTGGSSLVFDGGSLGSSEALFGSGSLLAVSGNGGSFTGNSLTLGQGATLTMDLSSGAGQTEALLSVSGQMNLTGSVFLMLGEQPEEGAVYCLMDFTGGTAPSNWQSMFTGYTGTLELSDNVLYLINNEDVLYWKGGNGTWETPSWSSSQGGADSLEFRDGAFVCLIGASTSEAIEIQETHQVRGMSFDGRYVLYTLSDVSLEGLSKLELKENAAVELGVETDMSQATVSLAAGSELVLYSSAEMRLLKNEGSLVLRSGDLSLREATQSSGSITLSDGSITLVGAANSLGALNVSGELRASGTLRLTDAAGVSSVGSVSAADLSIAAEAGHRLRLGSDSSLRDVQGGAWELGGRLELAASSSVDELDFGTQGSLSLGSGASVSVSGEVRGTGSVIIAQPHEAATPYLSAGSVSTGCLIDFRGVQDSSILSELTSGQKLVLATVSGDNAGSYSFDGKTETQIGDYHYSLVQQNRQVYILPHLDMNEWVGQSGSSWMTADAWTSAASPDRDTKLSFQGAGDALVTLGEARADEVIVEYNLDDKPEGYTWEDGGLSAASLRVRSGSVTLADTASATLQSTQVSGDGQLIILGRLETAEMQATAVTLDGAGTLTLGGGSSVQQLLAGANSVGTTLAVSGGSVSIGTAAVDGVSVADGATLRATSLTLTGSNSAVTGAVQADELTVALAGCSLGTLMVDSLIFSDIGTAGAGDAALTVSSLSSLTPEEDVRLNFSSLNVSEDGVYTLLSCTSAPSSGFVLTEAAKQYLSSLRFNAELVVDGNSVALELDTLGAMVWRTNMAADVTGVYTVPLGGADMYQGLVPIQYVVVNGDKTLDYTQADPSSASVPSLGAVVRNMSGIAGKTLSFVGNGIEVDRVTFVNDAEDVAAGAHGIAGEKITLQVGATAEEFAGMHASGILTDEDGSENRALTVGGVELSSAALVIRDEDGVKFTTGVLNGDADSSIAGEIHINGAGGFFSGKADTLAGGADIVLESGAEQSFARGEGLRISGSAGSATLAGNTLGALETTGADIRLTPSGSTTAPSPIALEERSSMQGGTLTATVDADRAFGGEGAESAIFSGESIALQGTHLVLNSAASAGTMVADVDLSRTDGFVITQLHEQGQGSAAGVSVSLASGLLHKYFGNAAVQGNQVLASRNTSYYANAAAVSPNGGAGLALADAALVAFNPQAGANSASLPDLAALLNSLDASIAAGNRAGADRLGATFAGAEAAGMGMAFAHDMERQLRAIRNRTTTMGADDEYVNPDMPYFNAWINAEGDYRRVNRDGTAPGYTLSSWGGTLGADADISPQLTAGLAFTAMYGDYRAVSNGVAQGDLDSYYVTLFGRYGGRSAWVHTLVASVGVADASLKRTVTHANGSYTAEGDTTGMGFGLLYELGYTIALNEEATTCLQPVLNLSYVHTALDGYRESGSDAALNFGNRKMDSFTVGLGARLQTQVGETVYNRTSMFESRALLKFTTGDRHSSMHTALASLPEMQARVKSEEQGAIGAELGAGLSVPLGAQSGTLFFDASLEAYSGYTNVNATVGWRINF